ncbi:MAG: hypothetical protein QW315_06910 [Candidatus Hadarchaeum sp.]
MQWVAKNSDLNPDNPILVAAVRLLVMLEFSNATMRWYAGKVAGREDLPSHETILALALNLASIAEALKLFEDLVAKRTITFEYTWPAEVQSAWEFLQREEVKNLKTNHLLRIRDKSVFHIDPQPVADFLRRRNKELGETVVLETGEWNKHGFSPLAAEIEEQWIIQHTMHNPKYAELSSQTYGAIRKVVAATIGSLITVHGRHS